MGISIGDTFGRLTVTDGGILSGRNRYWFCTCTCGKQKEICYSSLASGRTKSCGCLNAEMASARRETHGKSKTKIYDVWMNMKARCMNKKNSAFANYGGRGIKVCDKWMKFENFLEDMGKGDGAAQIDRIDNNGNYEPSNCKWSTPQEQAVNRRSNRVFALNGEFKTISQLSTEFGIEYFKLRARLIRLNWDLNRSLTTP